MQNKASQKQTFFFTLINYLGIVIGIVSTLFIYPKNKEILGIIRYVEALSQVLFPLLLLGASQALIKFNPNLSTILKKKIFNYGLVSIAILSLFALVFITIVSFIPAFKGIKYVYFAFPIGVFLAYVELFKKQATIIQKIAVPTFFDNIIPKIALPILFLLLLTNFISINQSLVLYVLSYGLIFILVGYYLHKNYPTTLNFNFNELFKNVSKSEYYRFSLFAFAGSLGSVFAFRIDALMIPKFISMEAGGTFSIGVTLASAIAIPATGLFTLYAPIISNLIKNNSWKELNMKYKEISRLLFFIGVLLYGSIFLGIENLFLLLPTHQNLVDSIPIILILGLNVLINMGTGFNGEIITYSKYYRFNLIAIGLLIVLNISLNLLFINYYNFGIKSVAIASLISMVFFNAAKLIFIYKKFTLLPFDLNYLKLVLISVTLLFLIYILPTTIYCWINLIYKCTLYLTLNLIVIYKLKLVYQYNISLNSVLKRVFKN